MLNNLLSRIKTQASSKVLELSMKVKDFISEELCVVSYWLHLLTEATRQKTQGHPSYQSVLIDNVTVHGYSARYGD
jgi:hypothetical protein